MDERDTSVNRIRGLGFMSGVLERQGREPLCSRCVSFALTLEESREALKELDESIKHNDVPEEFRKVLEKASATILGLSVPSTPIRQRKEGECRLPDKACFVKKARRLFLFFRE